MPDSREARLQRAREKLAEHFCAPWRYVPRLSPPLEKVIPVIADFAESEIARAWEEAAQMILSEEEETYEPTLRAVAQKFNAKAAALREAAQK